MSRRLFLPALLVLAALPIWAKPTPAEWKKLEGEAKAAFAGTNGDDRVNAVKAVGAADCLDGVKLLVQLLDTPDKALAAAEAARDAFEPEFAAALDRINKFAKQGKGTVAQSEMDIFMKKQNEMDSLNEKVHALSSVPDAIGEALALTKDAEAVKWLVETGLPDKAWRTRSTVAYALGFAPADQSNVNPALVAAAADKDARVRAASIEALGRRGAKEAKDLILKALEDERWQVRVAACEALGALGLRETVAPLIARMQEESGRILEDLDRALKALTGLSFHADALGWKGWWQLNQADWESGKLSKKEEPKKDDKDKKPGDPDPKDPPGGKDAGGGNDPGGAAGAGMTVTFYGIESKSKNLIFVVDVSGSMAENALDQAPDPKGPGPKGKRKIDVARYELSHAVGMLPEDARFNIITFSSDVKVYSPQKMVVATKANKTAAQKFAEALEPQEATNIFDALQKAFEISGGAGGMQVDENYKSGVDTIFFMTDGEPTTGRTRDPKEIADTVKKWNAVRKIRIHCVGIGKCAEELLKRLADESGGQFVKR